MKVYSDQDKGFDAQVAKMLQSSSLFDQTIFQQTSDIIEAVRKNGDRALCQFAQKFDGAELTPAMLRVSDAEIREARKVPISVKRAIRAAADNIRAFSRISRRRNWQMRNSHQALVGEKFDPFARVGLYVPGGSAPLVSTALMTVTLAKIAGCPEIVTCTPCGSDGAIHTALLYALDFAGATEIYRVGGAQAIAAMACGTTSIRPVRKIFGPGNAYVVTAKRVLFGQAAIDLLPGPSEILIIADETAKPDWAAADLIAQAEHGSGRERIVLLATSKHFVKQVMSSVKDQLSEQPRASHIQKTLSRNGWCLQVKNLETAIAITNRFAPEHCQIMTKNSRRVSRQITTAGAIFLGDYSPTVLGDYVAGPSHVLPTGGSGRSFSGLTVDQFQRRTSIVQYHPDSLKKALLPIAAFAEVEGLAAHGRSASIRFN